MATHFESYKSKRIVLSPMASEVVAFGDFLDTAACISSELQNVYNRKIPLQLFSDSKSLFDVISTGSRTSEKRLMLDIAAAREGSRDSILSNIGFIADGLAQTMT